MVARSWVRPGTDREVIGRGYGVAVQGTRIRTATEADLDAVAAIYDEQVATGVATFDTEPRGPAHFAGRLAAPDRPPLAATDWAFAGIAGLALSGLATASLLA